MRAISSKKSQIISVLIMGLFFLAGLTIHLAAQGPVDGEMTFTVRTETPNGNFSPKHVLAIWIEDEAGFVKTRKLRGEKRMQYLYTWNSKSGGNVVDANTGATLSSHQTHNITWDCRDINGDMVPDGTYSVNVELTDQHAQGPIQIVSFTKGPDAVSMTPADETNFKDMELQFVPVVVLAASFEYSVDNMMVAFTNTSTGADSYSWDFGDGNSSTEESPAHTYTDPDTYTVVLTAIASSGSVTNEQNVTVSFAVTNHDYLRDVPVTYPNPTNGILIIQLENQDKNTAVKIYDLRGTLLYIENFHKSGSHQVDISNFSDGIYVFQVEGENHSSQQLIIKE